jgi:integrase
LISIVLDTPLSARSRNLTGYFAAIGKKAGVIVNKDAGKYASAHDFRRSFGTRWATRVMPAVPQKLMRHSAIETALRYYADINADGLAETLWKGLGSAMLGRSL